MEFSEPRIYTLIAVVLLIGGVVVSLMIENSRFGLALLAIRQNELAAEAAGINARLWKMRSLVVSGMMGAVAGGFYARVLLVVTPDSVFGMLVSAQAVVVTLFGGVASVWGPVIGAAILVPLAETLQAELGTYLPGIQGVVYGVAIIAIMLLSPDGLFWTVRDRWLPPEDARSRIPDIGPAADAGPAVQAAVHAGGAAAAGRGLSRAFGGLRAVSEVSFSVTEGEILGIIGPNGAGKTTLFNVLNGVLAADEGSARLDGAADAGQEDARGLPHGRGPHVPGRAQLPAPARARQRDRRGVRRRAVRSATRSPRRCGRCTRSGLQDQSGVPAGQLTNKQLRLMELARALAGNPRLLLLDETLAGLGPGGVRRRAGRAGAAARGGHDDRASSSTRCTR